MFDPAWDRMVTITATLQNLQKTNTNWQLDSHFEHTHTHKKKKKKESMILPGIEPGTLSVLDSHDNHYTTESTDCHKVVRM